MQQLISTITIIPNRTFSSYAILLCNWPKRLVRPEGAIPGGQYVEGSKLGAYKVHVNICEVQTGEGENYTQRKCAVLVGHSRTEST